MKMNNMTFMVLLNFLRVNTQMTGLVATSKNTLTVSNNTSHMLRNKHLRVRLKNATLLSTNLPSTSTPALLDKSTVEPGNWSSIELYSFNQHIFLSAISNYIEKWLLDEALVNTSQSTNSQVFDLVKPNLEDPSAPFKRSIPVLDDVRFFQLWKETGTKNADENFTLKNNTPSDEYDIYTSISNTMNSDQYNSMSKRVSRMKAILVKDTRYRSLMKKWITNRRHGRARGDFSSIDSNFSNSTRSNVSYPYSNTTKTSPNCKSCPSKTTTATNLPRTKSNSTIDGKTSIVNCTLKNETNISCNSSNTADNKSAKSTDNDDPEARFYDPLMPYPEEYPEEYQTIQNGPALIISRTTYTRIPNVTYTTITMVTLPTYRLVEKAENAFAATLFEERSSKSSSYLHAGAGCDTEHHSSTDFLQHSRR